MREPLRSLRGFPSTDAVGVLCGAGSTLLHNNLGGQGGRDGDDASGLSPECDGRTQNDDCSKAMGALAPSTQSPKGSGPASPVRLSSRVRQSSETLSALLSSRASREACRSTCGSRPPRITTLLGRKTT